MTLYIDKVRKDQARKEFDANYIPIVRLLEATFRVAGETELADRIRPTVRQLTRNDDKEKQAKSEEVPSSEAAASDSPEPESGSAAASESQAS